MLMCSTYRIEIETDCHGDNSSWFHQLLITEREPMGNESVCCHKHHHQMGSHHSGVSTETPYDTTLTTSHPTLS